MKRFIFVVLITSIFAAIIARQAKAYVLGSSKWPSPQTTMNISIGSPWDAAFINAMGFWTDSTVFDFNYVTQFADPCSNPNMSPPVNGVKFSDTVCGGGAWGATTLAVATTWSVGGTRLQSGISFNSKYTWNVYDGPYATGVWAGVQDFQRVALHELGHVIGLSHEDSAPAIMSTFVANGSTIIRPQADDIAGVNALYGSGGVDTTGPAVVISSPANGQTVSSATITVFGTATDLGRGDNGIASVRVNGINANGGTATGTGTANWSRTLTLNPGSNSITVTATDDSAAHNSTTTSITVNYSSGNPTSPTSSTYHVFPQFADGRFGDGSYYRTTLMISNPTTSGSASCTMQLRGLTVPGFDWQYTVGPGQWVIAPTTGAQNFQSGYATLQCSLNVEAQLLYSYYSNAGVKLSEATVFSSPSASAVKLLADQREGARLGIAIANDSDASITYGIAVSGGASGSVTVGPRSSIARFLDEMVSGVPANLVGQVMVSSSNGAASIIGLRFTGPVFTTIGESIASFPGPTASTYHIFPQIADGRFSDGASYRTTRMYVNPSASTADCTTRLRGLTIGGVGGYTASLSPGGGIIAASPGTQNFQSGYVTLECSSAVDAQVLYSYYSPIGTKLGEATVFSSPAAQYVQILADSREGAQVGLAIANDSDQTHTFTIAVYDANGVLVGSTDRTIPGRTSIARFVNEFVPLPPNHYGQVIVSSTTGTASIIGLRYTGATFTTIPETIR